MGAGDIIGLTFCGFAVTGVLGGLWAGLRMEWPRKSKADS